MKEAEEGANKAFHAEEHAPAPGPGREESPEERDGVPDTDTTGRTPLGVGESINERAEDIARKAEERAGTDRAGTKGASGRPYGGAAADESGGVNSQPSTTEGSPDLAPGDQGG